MHVGDADLWRVYGPGRLTMKLQINDRKLKFCLLIPTRGRDELMMKNMAKMKDVWNRPGVYFAIENREKKSYGRVIANLPKAQFIFFDNRDHSVGWALEQLRRHAVKVGYDYYVCADDNCVFTNEAMDNLVTACATWKRPCHMAGFHGTAPHFDAKRLRTELKKHGGVSSYRKMAWIFRCVPHLLYKDFQYPEDLPCYGDRYFSFWLIANGFLDFRATPDAPFTKKRFMPGGIGTKDSRKETARGLARIAVDFPEVFGPHEVIIPWEHILKMHREARKQK
jgi:hypothetical protein